LRLFSNEIGLDAKDETNPTRPKNGRSFIFFFFGTRSQL